jgi:hypothetical protein
MWYNCLNGQGKTKGENEMIKTSKDGQKYEIENRYPEIGELAWLPNAHVYLVVDVNKAQNICKLDAPKWYEIITGYKNTLRVASPIF